MTHHYTVLHGGTVLTFDDAAPSDAAARGAGVPDAAGRRATAICFAADRILAVGSDEEILALAGPETTVVDLGGRAVVPGFVDAHAHPYWEGLITSRPNLEALPDLRAAMRVLPAAGEHLDPDAWLVGRYNHVKWPERRHPTRDDLDRAVPDRPVVLAHVSGHALVANSLALALAGFTAETPDRAGALVLVRDAAGQPTGVIEGTEAWAIFAAGMPVPTQSEIDAAFASVTRRLAADGVTWAADADLGSAYGFAHELAAYGDALARGTFPLGVSLMPGATFLAPEPGDPLPTPGEILAALPADARGRAVARHLKLKADGALTTRTAWLSEPYDDDSSTVGRPVHAPAALIERVRRAAAAGWGVATHAIGDAAIAAVLDAYEAADAFEAHTGASGPGPHPHAPHRIEHAMLLPPPLFDRLARAGRPVVLQPEFTAWAWEAYRMRLGDRVTRLLPYAEMLAVGVPVAFSSDRPVVGGAPLAGIRAACKHDPGISVAEALSAWTVGAASAAGVDGAGRLAVGERADLLILNRDPLAPPRRAWVRYDDNISVVATIAGGRLVFGGIESLERLEAPRDPEHVASPPGPGRTQARKAAPTRPSGRRP